jgi:hypothetical protein
LFNVAAARDRFLEQVESHVMWKGGPGRVVYGAIETRTVNLTCKRDLECAIKGPPEH